jgi:hypothetical protein
MPNSTFLKVSALVVAAVGASSAFGDELNLQGYVTGHFNSGSSTTYGGLSYTGSTFNVTTAGNFYGLGGNAAPINVNNLGSFALNGSTFNYSSPATFFTLDVTFTQPTGVSGSNSAIYTAILQGDVVSKNGGVYIQFDNSPRLFNFTNSTGTGSFDLSVNDLSLYPSQTSSVTGYGHGSMTPVPEPCSLAAIGMGLGGFFVRRRRRTA